MSINLIRYNDGWGVVRGTQLLPLPGHYPTTADVLSDGVKAARELLAQARIVGAVERVASHPPDDDLAIVGHGGTGTLLYCHLAGCRSIGVMTSRRQTAETGLPLTGRPENFFGWLAINRVGGKCKPMNPFVPIRCRSCLR